MVSLNALRNLATSATSATRASALTVTLIVGSSNSSPVDSSILILSAPRPTAMMAPCGGFKIALNESTGNIPRLLTLKLPPVNSCGFKPPFRARPASSRTSSPIAVNDLASAPRTIGVIKPPSVATAMATSTSGSVTADALASSHLAFTFGDALSALATA